MDRDEKQGITGGVEECRLEIFNCEFSLLYYIQVV